MNNQIKKLQELIKLDQDLQSIQDLDILLEKILYNTRKFVNADAGTIYLREGNVLVFSYAQNETKEKELKPGQKLIYSVLTVDINEHSICGYVAKTKKILNIPDVYKLPKKSSFKFNSKYDKVSEYKTNSMLTIPLMTNTGNVLGVIQVINALDEKGNAVPFDIEDELFVMHFASTASMALQRAQLTRQIILRMISMAELRDPKETGPHVNRVASFAVELYERWAGRRKIAVKEIEKNKDLLRMAAMLHDVGKVGISDIILKKPGKFTDDEYEIMKTHTFHGATLFKSMQSDFDDLAAMVALTHHENWDGTGYPGNVDIETGKPLKTDINGKVVPLKGEDIPIFGRVVAIADVFDALSSKRVYKQAWEEADVLIEMKNLSGKKFDPELVEILFESLEHFRNIMHRYPE